MTAGLAVSALAAATFALRETPDPMLVARWWPATALATAMLVSAPLRQIRPLLVVFALIFLVSGLAAGRGAVFSVGFTVANLVEGLIVLWWLTGFELAR